MSSIFSGEGLLDVGLGSVKSIVIESVINETSVDLGEGSDALVSFSLVHGAG